MDKIEWRKHANQMTTLELIKIKESLLLFTINDITDFTPTYYCQGRMESRGIYKADIDNCIIYGTIIEFHFVDGAKRVLIRGIRNRNNKSICTVVDIESRKIITVYPNDYEDNHSTLKEDAYTGLFDLMPYLGLNLNPIIV